MNACREFRSRLADLIAGHAPQASLGRLAWHEHLLGCNACRELLQSEEALELLLTSLPDPHFPPELARRLLVLLEPARADAALDSLLDHSLAAPVPSDLARSTLDKLASARRAANEAHEHALAEKHADAALDRLLEAVPVPVVPATFSQRMLASLKAERELERTNSALAANDATTTERASFVRTHLAPTRRTSALQVVSPEFDSHGANVASTRAKVPTSRRLLVAAALIGALGFGAWIWSRFESARSGESELKRGQIVDSTPIERALIERKSLRNEGLEAPSLSIDEPPEDLLASLDLLESWELLIDDSLEVELVLDGYEILLVDTELNAEPQNEPQIPPRDSSAPSEPKSKG